MTPRDMLQALHAEGAGREAAARELLDLLRLRARRCLARFRLSVADAEDVVSAVVVSLLRTRRLDLAARSDGGIVGYLEQMLEHTAITRWRADRRRLEPVDPSAMEGRGGSAPAPDRREIAEPLAALEQVFEILRASRARRYQPSLDVAWLQLLDLLLGRRTMDDLVAQDEHVLPGAAPRERVRARDRILQSHHRLRMALADLVDRLPAAELAPDRAAAAREALSSMYRCHRGAAGDVREDGGSTQ